MNILGEEVPDDRVLELYLDLRANIDNESDTCVDITPFKASDTSMIGMWDARQQVRKLCGTALFRNNTFPPNMGLAVFQDVDLTEDERCSLWTKLIRQKNFTAQ